MTTLGAVMQKHRGIGPGFDFLRLFLALAVVLWHSFQVSYGNDFVHRALDGPYRALIYFIVPAFFALSGYLVAGSMVRLDNVRIFLIFRALRIVPALGTEITLSALILGPVVTSFALDRYFTDREFVVYFTNIVGLIKYHLPGVFLGNPVSGIVNGQLWTVPAELHCYVALAVLMLTRLARRRLVMLGVFLAFAGAWSLSWFLPGGHFDWWALQSSSLFVACFLCGNVFYLWRDAIPASRLLLAGAVASYGLVTYVVPALSYLVGVAAITYATCYLGLKPMPRVPLIMRGDYSYGIYLYSYPMQQFVIWALPGEREWYFNLAIAAPITILFSMASWHGIEKPMLSLRKRFSPKVVTIHRTGADAPLAETR